MTSHGSRMLRLVSLLAFCLPGLLSAIPAAQAQVRLRDLVQIEGVRGNQLVGYGLVIGLQATGDTLRNAPFTQQSLNAMLERMGVNVNDQKLQTRNTAAVVVTATLPAFARQGMPVDVQVSSLGDARSLQGGTLMVTPLLGADGEVYAVSQGPLIVGGITAAGAAQAVREGVTTSGRIPGGGLVEREVPNRLDGASVVRLALRSPDFTTAERIEQALNARLGPGSAAARDLGTVDVQVPPQYQQNMTALIANIEQVQVETDTPARVVIDEKSGTIVVGADVKIDTSGGDAWQPDRDRDRNAGSVAARTVLWRPDGGGAAHRHQHRSQAGCPLQDGKPQRQSTQPGGWAERVGIGSTRHDPGVERTEGIRRTARRSADHLACIDTACGVTSTLHAADREYG